MLLSLSLAVALAAPVRIEAAPSLLVLGKDAAHAALTIASRTRPRLSANVGQVRNLRLDAPDAWVAEYVPPDELFPQIAIVAAVADEEVAWVAISLSGQGVAEVRTRARAKISVKIGGETFGPTQADRHGEALVPVIVPPGVHEALHGRQRIDLRVPPIPRLHVVVLDDHVRADRIERLAVLVLATEENGRPLKDARVRLLPARGEVAAVKQRAPGEYRAQWMLQPGRTGRVRIVATLEGGAAPATAAQITVEPGPAAAIDLTADRDTVMAGAGTEIVFRAKARDSMGNPATEPLELAANGFGAVTEAGPLAWRLRPPDTFGGRASQEIAAHPRARPTPRASVILRLEPAEPALASVQPTSATARIGGAPVRLYVVRTDRFGNAVAGTAPTAVAGEGQVAEIDPLPDGGFVATYVPPARWDRDDTSVEMRWPGAATRTDLVLLPRLAPLTVSPKLGALSNFGRLHSPVVGVEAAFRTDRLGPELGLATELGWYFVSLDQAGPTGATQARDDFVTLSVLLSLRVHAGARTALWVGVGPSVELLASSLQVGSQPRISESGLVPGVQVAVGVERRFAHGLPFAEVRWSWHRDPGFSTLTGAISAFSVVLGNRFELL